MRDIDFGNDDGYSKSMSSDTKSEKPNWTFFSNHCHVLVYLDAHPDMPLREVAQAIGITERAVQGLVKDLEKSGVIERKRVGRQNQYILHRDTALRHPLEAHCTIGQILSVIHQKREGAAT